MSFALEGARVWVAGHRGMVGSAVVRRLQRENVQILTAPRQELDLLDYEATRRWVLANRPDVVVLAAAKVGGILANDTYPADFLRDNLLIELNVIRAAFEAGVRKLLFLGSSCIYPKFAPQPISEESLLTGPLEPTNEWYAIAKIAGIKLCEAYRKQHGVDFISAQPCNLYGPNDYYDLQKSHVLPAMIVKIDRALAEHAPTVPIWGTGTPRREFLHTDDLADAVVFLLRNYSGPVPVNIGTGVDVTIAELAEMVARAVGWQGRFEFDPTKPDGTPRKLLDVSFINNLGWKAKIGLEDGIRDAYEWFRSNRETARAVGH